MTGRLLAAIAATALLAAGCGGGGDEGVADEPRTDAATETQAPADDGGQDEGEAASGDQVLVQGFRFQPEALAVAAGTTVTWSNEDDISHTATSGTPDAPTGEFDVALDGSGASGEHTFDEPGTYAYFCEVHPSMQGEITVS